MNSNFSTRWRTESRDLNEKVAEFRSMLNDLTRLTSNWVWETDEDFRFSYVSNQIFDSLGIPSEDVIGKKLSQLGTMRSSSGASLDLDYRKPFRDIRFDAEDINGSPRSLLISGLPVYDRKSEDFSGVRGITRDITATKKARESSDQLGFAIENFSESFFLTDSSDRIVIGNQKFRDINRRVSEYNQPGTPFEEHIRAVVAKGLIPEAIGKEEEWISYRLYLHRHPHGFFEIHREGGKVLRMHEEKLPNGCTATFAMDITQLKKTESALRESNERNHAFTSNAAHQLRTPLGVLSANIDSIEDRKVAKSLRQDIDVINRIVEQLLDGNRWDNLEVSADDQADLSEICRKVISTLAPAAIRKSKTLDFVSPDESVWVNGIVEPIEVAIRNLIENAIQYSSPKSEITIELSTDHSVSIINNGPCILPNEIERILNQDIRFDRRGGHVGLGLEIVKGIMKTHQATLSLESDEASGTMFKLQFIEASPPDA